MIALALVPSADLDLLNVRFVTLVVARVLLLLLVVAILVVILLTVVLVDVDLLVLPQEAAEIVEEEGKAIIF